jgi:hypothetical protein
MIESPREVERTFARYSSRSDAPETAATLVAETCGHTHEAPVEGGDPYRIIAAVRDAPDEAATLSETARVYPWV